MRQCEYSYTKSGHGQVRTRARRLLYRFGDWPCAGHEIDVC